MKNIHVLYSFIRKIMGLTKSWQSPRVGWACSILHRVAFRNGGRFLEEPGGSGQRCQFKALPSAAGSQTSNRPTSRRVHLFRTLWQYRGLISLSNRHVSKPRDWVLTWSYCTDIRQTPPHQYRERPGDRLNIKMSSYQYRDPHVKDKTVSRSSYL